MAIETIHPPGMKGVFIASLHPRARTFECVTGSSGLPTRRRPTVFPGISSGLTLLLTGVRYHGLRGFSMPVSNFTVGPATGSRKLLPGGGAAPARARA